MSRYYEGLVLTRPMPSVECPSLRPSATYPRPFNRSLDAATVRAIRRAYRDGQGGYKTLGRWFGLPWETVRNIVKYRCYRDVTDEWETA